MKGEVVGMGAAICGALSTILGALVVFCMSSVKPWIFSICMGSSAGVMIFVSVAEMFPEAVLLFTESGVEHGQEHALSAALAYLYSTLLFLFGWTCSIGFNWAVHRCLDSHTHFRTPDADVPGIGQPERSTDVSQVLSSGVETAPPNSESGTEANATCGWAAKGELSEMQKGDLKRAEERFYGDHNMLYRVGLFTATALGLHNLPEGIAAFSGSMANPIFGVGIGVAIALHNIPEGFAVSVPIYHSTGSKWKGVGMAAVTGLAEPLGAGLAWIFLSFFTDLAVLGGCIAFTAGIMAFVALTELFPTALRYDPLDRVSSLAVFGGIAVMAGSLVAIGFTEV